MRIVAGEFRGRVVKPPQGEGTRPTTDRVREAMFSSVFSRLGSFKGVAVLDAFAGSGALGLEALSRGSASCLFYERDAGACRVLEGNISSLGLPRNRARVRAADVFDAAAQPSAVAVPVSLVFLDPPYAYAPTRVLELVERLAAAGCLVPGAVVVYEHAASEAQAVADAAQAVACLAADGQKRYGKIAVSYFICQGAGQQVSGQPGSPT